MLALYACSCFAEVNDSEWCCSLLWIEFKMMDRDSDEYYITAQKVIVLSFYRIISAFWRYAKSRCLAGATASGESGCRCGKSPQYPLEKNNFSEGASVAKCSAIRCPTEKLFKSGMRILLCMGSSIKCARSDFVILDPPPCCAHTLLVYTPSP